MQAHSNQKCINRDLLALERLGIPCQLQDYNYNKVMIDSKAKQNRLFYVESSKTRYLIADN